MRAVDLERASGSWSFYNTGMRSRWFSLLSPLALLAGCDGCGPVVGGDGGVPSGLVVVNELLALNETGLMDEAGERDDWIELYNPGDADVDLGGFGLSDDAAAPSKLRLPAGTVLPARAFLLVWADDDPEQGPLHAPFRLSGAGEAVVLTDGAGALVDEVTFGAQAPDVSIGRSPDGEGDLVALLEPTPGAANAAPREAFDGGPPPDAGPPPLAPVMNEVTGAPASFVELYNPHDEDVALAGLHLSPNPVVPTRWAIPEGVAPLAPGGFALFFLDGDESAGAYHASFGFNDPGTLVLASAAGVVLEQVSVPSLDDDESFARLPDGDGAFRRALPTGGASNAPLPDAGPAESDAGLGNAADAGDAG